MNGNLGTQPPGALRHQRTLFSSRPEYEIASLIAEVTARAPGVVISTRPRDNREQTLVGIVLTSPDEGRLEAAAAWLAERLPGQPTA